MKQCPECGADYDVTDVICVACGADLPAPYEKYGDDDAEVTQAESGVISVLGDADPAVLAVLGAPAVDLAALTANLRSDQLTILSGATIFVGEHVVEAGTVGIAGDRIIAVLDTAIPNPGDGSQFIDLRGLVLAPGFIELHSHGMMGIDTNSAGMDDFLRISTEAARHGLTGITPTTVACSAEQLRSVLQNLRDARAAGMHGTRLLGVHMESNFISMAKKGAQPPDQIFSPDDPRAQEILDLIDAYQDEVRIVTLAPELSGALELIGWLRERNIFVSLGHSTANYDQAIAGFDAGATMATHLFNAMSPLAHREPGLVGAALERDDVYTEMVCDGVHIHPSVISTVISAKGSERFIPVSDSLQGAGLGEGDEFFLGGQHVTVRDGVARLDSGTIAGSVVTMDKIVQMFIETLSWDLGEALTMASTTPADALELTHVGRILPGAIADLVVLDADLSVVMTFVGGRVVYQRDAQTV